jgi:hypothetical protein
MTVRKSKSRFPTHLTGNQIALLVIGGLVAVQGLWIGIAILIAALQNA